MKNFTLEDKQKAALDQGKAYMAALDLMKEKDVHAEKKVGDYIITVACEEAEGMYMVQPEGDLQWEIPGDEMNQHIEIVVQDREDLRFIPGLTIHLALSTEKGNEIVAKNMPFLWHPFLYHYGVNVHLPENGKYIAKVTINTPLFGRHDEDKGKRYSEKITVEFDPIIMELGRKEYGPE